MLVEVINLYYWHSRPIVCDIHQQLGAWQRDVRVCMVVWSLANPSVEQFRVAWGEALRHILDLPYEPIGLDLRVYINLEWCFRF